MGRSGEFWWGGVLGISSWRWGRGREGKEVWEEDQRADGEGDNDGIVKKINE